MISAPATAMADAPGRVAIAPARSPLSPTGHVLALAATLAIGSTIDVVGIAPAVRGVPPFEVAPAIVVAVGVAALLAIPLGLLQWTATTGLRAISSRSGLAAWWAQLADRNNDERAPTVSAHAELLAIIAGAIVVGVAAFVVVGPILRVDNVRLARSFGAIVLAVAGLGAIAGARALAAWLPSPLARLDARVRLPWPASSGLRALLWLALPTVLLGGGYALRHRTDLGMYAAPIWGAIVIVSEIALVQLWRAHVHLGAQERKARWIGLAALGLVGLAGARGSADAAVGEWLRFARSTATAFNLLRWAADVDRDGQAAVLGSHDCAPFDPTRFPGAPDIPGNGIDENCDGEDAAPLAAGELVRFAGSVQPIRERPLDVILVVIDALRIDHTRIGGGRRPNTPYLDAFAEEGLWFRNAHSQSSATMLSVPSILTGRDPSRTLYQPAKRLALAEEELTLTRRLSTRGYATTLVANEYFEEFLERVRGDFDDVEIVPAPRTAVSANDDDDEVDPAKKEAPWKPGQSEGLTSRAIAAIERVGATNRPYFMLLYMPDPHAPYDRHGFGLDFGPSKGERYDSEIANVDRHLGFLFEHLRASGRWDHTLIVVTSDHGEEFNEHGGTRHARTCYNEVTHVPLALHVPGLAPAKIDDLVGLVDIAPTVLEIIGATDNPGKLDGQSLLVPVQARANLSADRTVPCAIISQKLSQGNFFVRAIRSSQGVLVHERIDDRWEFYDAVADPRQKVDLWEQRRTDPEVVRLRQVLEATLEGNLPRQLLTN